MKITHVLELKCPLILRITRHLITSRHRQFFNSYQSFKFTSFASLEFINFDLSFGNSYGNSGQTCQFSCSCKSWIIKTQKFFSLFRLPGCTIGSMVGKVVEYSGFSKPEMKFVLSGLLNICLILLESRSLMRASR